MKKVFVLIFTVTLLAVSSCTKEGPTKDPVEYDYFIKSTNSLELEKKELPDYIKVIPNDYKALLSIVLGMLPGDSVAIDVINFKGEDPQGKTITTSGTITYPIGNEIKGIIVSPHFTITSNAQAPSVSLVNIESIFALIGYVVIQPDLIGFGVSSDKPHPYLDIISTANQCIDMFFASQEFIQSKGGNLGNSIYIAGYSQGGAGALALQKMIEEEYSDKIHINKVYVGAGPYDLENIFKTFTTTFFTNLPGSVPYTVLGMDAGRCLNLDLSKIFKEPLLSNYEHWYYSKKFTIQEINKFLDNSTDIRTFMHESFLDRSSPEFEPFYKALADNSLVDWTPKAPLFLFHGKNDTYVPYSCSKIAYQSFKNRGCDVELFTASGDHEAEAVNFYLQLLKELK